MYVYTLTVLHVHLGITQEIATSSLPVQCIVEDCSGGKSSGFSFAPTKHTDAASPHSD